VAVVQEVNMKTVLPKQEFQEALAAVATLTGGRTPRPILSCVRLAAAGERIELSATDGEAGLRVGVTALSLKQPGQVVVPAERLLSIVRESADVELVLEADEKSCVLRGEGSEFEVYAASAADFPPVPEFSEEADLVISGYELRRMVSLTLYAAAREASRYAINGVLWEKQGKKLFMVATDGRRLARAGGLLLESKSGDFKAILPAKALTVLQATFLPPRERGAGAAVGESLTGGGRQQDESWPVQVRVLPNQMLLRSGGRMLSTVLVEGHFPNYQEVIPGGGDKRARLPREEFHSAVRRAALLTTEDSRAVKLSFTKDRLVITSQAPEHGKAHVELPVQYEGKELDIGFNPAFLNDALRAVHFEEVLMEFQESFRPGVLSGEDKSEFIYVIMPVSL
jgi:DNA polymerase-3 subunit beta